MRGKGPALFELMRAGKQPPRETRPPGSVPVPSEPQQSGNDAGGPALRAGTETPEPVIFADSAAERRATQAPFTLDRPLTIPMSAILLAAGGVLTLLVLVWVIGYRTGWTGGESQAVRDLGDTAPGVEDPLKQPPLNPNLLAAPSANPPTARPGDPRQAGLNYLRLAILKQSDAERAAEFLSRNGLPAFAIPVDRPGAPSKNPGLYVVYASQGVTRDELKAHVDAMEQTDAAAARLGPRWKKEFRSATDFADRYWDKYVP